MKTIKLTKGHVAKVDDEDFPFLSRFKWRIASARNAILYAASGSTSTKPSSIVYMHRLILGITDPKLEGDHRDLDGLNNQKYNLRICTRSQNCANTRKKRASTATSKYKGVFLEKGRNRPIWVAQIRATKNGITKTIKIGRYETELEAAAAYNVAAVMHFSEFARLNEVAA